MMKMKKMMTMKKMILGRIPAQYQTVACDEVTKRPERS